jgi:predicted Zn finger-like uncharacterized protein
MTFIFGALPLFVLLSFIQLLHNSHAFLFVSHNALFRPNRSVSFWQQHSTSPPQAHNGELVGVPDTYVRCGKCQTVYAITEQDLGINNNGRRLECAVCNHSWFQSKDRLMKVDTSAYELIPLPERDLERIQNNMEQGKSPKFLGAKKLYVGNIAFECHEDDFYDLFARCGEVGDVSLVRDEEGNNRGFGFITMRTEEAANKAIETLDGLSFRGRNIAVRESTS